MARHIWDENGNYRGSIGDEGEIPPKILLGLIIIGFVAIRGIIWLFGSAIGVVDAWLQSVGIFINSIPDRLAGWSNYEFPINILAAYYHYFVFIPIGLIFLPWKLIKTCGLTPYPNVNLIIAIIVMAVVLIVLLLFVIFAFALLGKRLWRYISYYIYGPLAAFLGWVVCKWLCIMLWSAVCGIFHWLTAKG